MASLIYSLQNTIFDGIDDYIDTEIQLFNGRTQWVVFIDFTSDEELDDNAVIYHMYDETEWKGLRFSVKFDPRGRIDGTQGFYVFHSVVAGNRHKVAIKRDGSTYACYTHDDPSIYYFGQYVNSDYTNRTLLIGVGINANNQLYGFYKGTVNDFRIYEGSMNDEEIISLMYDRPTITIGTPSRTKISRKSGYDQATVTFQSDSVLDYWEARATTAGQAIGHGSGLLVESGGSLAANTDATVYVDDEELTEGDREYTISIFGQSTEGRWSDG